LLDRLSPNHEPLFKVVLAFEWSLAAVALCANICALCLGWPAVSCIASLVIILLILPAGLYYPDRPSDPILYKRLYLGGQALLVTAASMLGVTCVTALLYLSLMAKIWMLLKRRERWIATGILLAAQLLAFYAGAALQDISFELDRPVLLKAFEGGGLLVGYLTGVTLIALAGLLTVTYMSEQRYRWKTRELMKEVASLSDEVERIRIAREIHDELGHTLSMLKLQLEVARKFGDVDRLGANKALRTAEQLASSSLTEVKVTLQSIKEKNFNFDQSLAELIKSVESSSGLSVRTEIEHGNIPVRIAYQLFRVVQECLTNTIRHAHAKRVKISSGVYDQKLSMIYWDDGDGFAYAAGTEGFGIRAMRERIEALGGSIAVASRAAGGTEVLVEVPLPQERKTSQRLPAVKSKPSS
jgi:signal transduction histidine kinase